MVLSMHPEALVIGLTVTVYLSSEGGAALLSVLTLCNNIPLHYVA